MAREHSDDDKSRVLADIAAGMPVARAAHKHGLSRSTVRNWVQAQPTGHAAAMVDTYDACTRDALARLVYDYLTTGFRALVAQHRRLAAAGASATAEDYRAILHGLIMVGRGLDAGAAEERAATDARDGLDA